MREHLRPVKDVRNSTTAILDKNLVEKKYYEYDEFGEMTEEGEQNFINDNTFTGELFAKQTTKTERCICEVNHRKEQFQKVTAYTQI